MIKGIAPLSQIPALVASGAPPRPNHACCEEGVDVCFQTIWRRGGEGFATRAIRFLKKKFSLRTTCPQCLHVLCPHTSFTSCAPTRRVPVMGFSSLGPQNMGDGSGGVEEGNGRGLRALVQRTIKVILVVTRRMGCFTGSLLFGLEKRVKALLVSCPLPDGVQWACPTIPLCSGLRFRAWQGWSMRCRWWHRGVVVEEEGVILAKGTRCGRFLNTYAIAC